MSEGRANTSEEGASDMVDEALEDRRLKPVSLEELIALNDEIASLARSGMPLEPGLMGLGEDLPGRLSAVAHAVGARMRSGETLSEALRSANVGAPPVYEAVVEAGIRSGRLAVALEGMASYAKALAEARRVIGLALWYPLLLLSLSYVLFTILVSMLMPKFVATFEDLGLPIQPGVRLLAAIGSTAIYWGPMLPLALIVFLIGWSLTNRASSLGGGGRFTLLRWVPWMNSMVTGFEAAGFADLLALLVEHHVPLNEAMTLAGRASGDPRMEKEAEAAARVLSEGRTLYDKGQPKSVFPPLLRWLISSGQGQAELVVGLRQMAERYRQVARYQGEKMRVILPTILLFGVGASSALIYGLALFVPLTSLWNTLSSIAP